MPKLLSILLLIQIVPCFAGNAEVKLVIKKNTRHSYSELIEANSPADCNGAEYCSISIYGLATIECGIWTSLDNSFNYGGLNLQMDAKSTSDSASNYHAVDNNTCISKIRCGFGGSHEPIANTRGQVEVSLASGSWCSNSTSEVYCESERSGCITDGPACTYTLKCTHRDS